MDELTGKLAGIKLPSVLDVATGKGDFLKLITDNLGGYDRAVGVDVDDEVLKTAAEQFVGNDRASVLQVSGDGLPFDDGEFDMVCISNALHHITEPQAVLAEMLRVCRSGGRLLIREMYREAANPQQEVFHEYHDLVCEMRAKLGHTFERVFNRGEIVDLVGSAGLSDLDVFEWVEPPSDPRDAEDISNISTALTATLESLAGGEKYESYQLRAEQLKANLAEVGCLRPSQVVVIGNVT